jgi:hypothetical protein
MTPAKIRNRKTVRDLLLQIRVSRLEQDDITRGAEAAKKSVSDFGRGAMTAEAKSPRAALESKLLRLREGFADVVRQKDELVQALRAEISEGERHRKRAVELEERLAGAEWIFFEPVRGLLKVELRAYGLSDVQIEELERRSWDERAAMYDALNRQIVEWAEAGIVPLDFSSSSPGRLRVSPLALWRFFREHGTDEMRAALRAILLGASAAETKSEKPARGKGPRSA